MHCVCIGNHLTQIESSSLLRSHSHPCMRTLALMCPAAESRVPPHSSSTYSPTLSVSQSLTQSPTCSLWQSDSIDDVSDAAALVDAVVRHSLQHERVNVKVAAIEAVPSLVRAA